MGDEQGAFYEIRVKGVLDNRWSEWFGGMTLSSDANGETTLSGPVAAQAVLHGLLARVRDLGVPLVSVRRRDENCPLNEPAANRRDLDTHEKDR